MYPPTFSHIFKLFFPAYLLTQAKNPIDTASREGNQNYPSSKNDSPDHPDQFELKPQLTPADKPLSDSYIYFIIMLKSLLQEKHKPH